MSSTKISPTTISLVILPQALRDIQQALQQHEPFRYLEGRFLKEENLVQVFRAPPSPTQQSYVLGKWFPTQQDLSSLESKPSLIIYGHPNDNLAFWNTIKIASTSIQVYTLHHLYDRVKPVLDFQTLQEKRVLIIGLGSVGSRVALELGRSGVGHLTLVDHDILEPENIVRHVTEIQDLGRYKVHAVKDRIHGIAPATKIHTITKPIHDDDLAEIVSLMQQHDLVVVALGPHEANTKLDHALHEARVHGIFAGVFRKGIGGTIIWVKPFETACYACIYNTLVRKGILQQAFSGVNHHFTLQDLSETRQDYGTGNLVIAEPALNIDISLIALTQAKLALYLLQDSPQLDYVGQAIVMILGTERNLLENLGNRKIISTGHLDKIPANYCPHYDSSDDFSIEDL